MKARTIIKVESSFFGVGACNVLSQLFCVPLCLPGSHPAAINTL